MYPCGRETGFCWWSTRASRPLRIFETLKAHSLALDYLDQRIDKVGNNFPGLTDRDKHGNPVIMEWGYSNWQDRLFQSDVMSMWELAVADFRKFSRHPFLFLITVDDPKERAKVARVTEILERAGISYADCSAFNERVYESGIRPRRFWANPADPHGGIEQSQGFAQCLYTNLDLGKTRLTLVHE
jgi:hypothetical protein